MFRRALASLLVVLLLGAWQPGRAEEPKPAPPDTPAEQVDSEGVYLAPAAPPEKAAPLTWRHAGRDTPGVWLTEQQQLKIGRRILDCEARLEKEIDLTTDCATKLAVAEGKVKVPTWVWIGIGLAGGVLAGYAAGHVVR